LEDEQEAPLYRKCNLPATLCGATKWFVATVVAMESQSWGSVRALGCIDFEQSCRSGREPRTVWVKANRAIGRQILRSEVSVSRGDDHLLFAEASWHWTSRENFRSHTLTTFGYVQLSRVHDKLIVDAHNAFSAVGDFHCTRLRRVRAHSTLQRDHVIL